MRIGFLLFPNLTLLDMIGPHEVLGRLPGAQVHLLWKTTAPVRSEKGVELRPTTTLADCPQLDLICVPGGPGADALLADAEVLSFLARQAAGAQWITSVCTGSLVLGAAGLLAGRRATTHWRYRDLLPRFGAVPVAERVVVDGNLVTGGGVTAGIDFGLTLAAAIAGREVAEAIQLGIEYAPAPPFEAGSPETAPDAVAERVRAATAGVWKQREVLVAAAADAQASLAAR